MKNKLFEEGMARFLKSLVEQDPLTPNVAPANQVPAVPAIPATPTAQVEPAPAAADPNLDLQQTGEIVATQYLDTKRLFYAKPPSDSADWTDEISRYPQYKPLIDRICPYLSTVFGKSFVAKRAGAARYNPNQFRISLMGTLTAPTILKYEENHVKILEITIPTLHSKQSVLKEPKEVNDEPLRIRAMSSTEKDKREVGKYKDGEEISKSELDTMIGQFSESRLIEMELSRPNKEIKREAWSKLEGSFKEWFLDSVIAKNPKSRVDFHISTLEGREGIKKEFAKEAKNMPDIDKEALSIWLGKEASAVKKKKMRFSEQMADAVVGMYEPWQKEGKLPGKEGAKWKAGEKEENAEEYVKKLVKKYPDFKPKTEKEAVSFVLSGAPPTVKEKQEERLKAFLKKILVETKNGRPVQKGVMGKEVSDLTLNLNNVVDEWIDNNSLISKKGGDIKTCSINFMTANDLRFEIHKLMAADGDVPQKEWNGKDPIQIVGNMIIKANIFVDARLQPDNKTWEFRTYDTHNNPLVKKFGIVSRDAEQIKHKKSSATKSKFDRGEIAPEQPAAGGTTPKTAGGKTDEI